MDRPVTAADEALFADTTIEATERREEAVVYAQTYGDAWDEPAKAFVTEILSGAAGATPSAGTADAPAGTEASAGG